MNILELLKQDHRKVKSLFHSFASGKGSRSETAREILNELDVHTQLEEEILYPIVRQLGDEQSIGLYLEAYEEHSVAKNLILELRILPLEAEHYDAKMKVLEEVVTHHIGEEEAQMFPWALEKLGKERLTELGQQMAETKASLHKLGLLGKTFNKARKIVGQAISAAMETISPTPPQHVKKTKTRSLSASKKPTAARHAKPTVKSRAAHLDGKRHSHSLPARSHA